MKELSKPYPTYEECEYLWEYYQTPPHVVRHCRAVSKTAVLLAKEMNQYGYAFDVELLAVSGWLHDMMRLQEDHGGAAARELRLLGYDNVADVVAIHMSYHLDPDKEDIMETDLLCFADRLVIEDQYSGLVRRMEYIIEKSKKYYHDAEPRIRNSFGRTRQFKKIVEAIIGKDIEEIEHMVDPLD